MEEFTGVVFCQAVDWLWLWEVGKFIGVVFCQAVDWQWLWKFGGGGGDLLVLPASGFILEYGRQRHALGQSSFVDSSTLCFKAPTLSAYLPCQHKGNCCLQESFSHSLFFSPLSHTAIVDILFAFGCLLFRNTWVHVCWYSWMVWMCLLLSPKILCHRTVGEKDTALSRVPGLWQILVADAVSVSVCLLLSLFVSLCLFCFSSSSAVSPWYNCTGWLGVKHQLTYSQCCCILVASCYRRSKSTSTFRTGIVRARSLELVIPPSQRYQGVICSMKESFGFIERADLVREIFFHYSEFRGNIDDLQLGGDVEFSIQMRNVSLCLPQFFAE